MLTKIKTFLKEFWVEMKKVSWPSRELTIASTWVVIFVCFAFAIYFAAVDFVFGRLITYFLTM